MHKVFMSVLILVFCLAAKAEDSDISLQTSRTAVSPFVGCALASALGQRLPMYELIGVNGTEIEIQLNGETRTAWIRFYAKDKSGANVGLFYLQLASADGKDGWQLGSVAGRSFPKTKKVQDSATLFAADRTTSVGPVSLEECL